MIIIVNNFKRVMRRYAYGTVVRLEDYCKSFKSAEVLKNINLTLESGKVIGLKGKNGSGKTMLMRAISGLILPTSGKVYINDKELGSTFHFRQV